MRTVLDKVGQLDERFTPGNFEDDDISVRIIKEGYNLMLCKDSFIYHFESVSFRDNPEDYYNLLQRNNIKFIKKWNFKSSRAMMLYKIDEEFIEENEEFINDIHKYLVEESGRFIVNLDAYYLDIEYFDISQIKHIQNELLKNRLDMKKIYKAQDKDKIYSIDMCF